MGSKAVLGVRGIRYQVKDMNRSIAFYTKQLGFNLEVYRGPALKPGQAAPFAELTHGSFGLLLSGPGASGSRPMPDGRAQEPGGWNRVVLRVHGLSECMSNLRKEGVRFRNDVEAGPGGKQVQIEDPDGNPIELFEPV